MTASVSAIVLAAAATSRMRSSRPRPLHLLCGRPLVQFVIDALPVDVERIVVVVDDGADRVAKKLAETAGDPRVRVVQQPDARGSADAALVGLQAIGDDVDPFGDDDVIVCRGDAPLLERPAVATVVDAHRRRGGSATVLVSEWTPGLGLIELRKDGTIAAVRPAHESDLAVSGASGGRGPHEPGGADGPAEPVGRLGDAGLYVFRRSLLAPALRRVRADVSSGRQRVSGVIEVLSETGNLVHDVTAATDTDARRVADLADLAAVEAAIRARTNDRWMRAGVTMIDPATTYVDVTVRLGPDVTLFPNTMLQGQTTIGAGAEIGPDTRLSDCAVGAGARVEKTMGRDAEIGERAEVGPFAALDAGAQIPVAVRTGPFYHASSNEPGPEGA